MNTKYYKSNGNYSVSSSIVARVSQIMIIIITLGLFSIISSILVTESLSGDAEQINHVGALRLQAMKISRAHLMQASTLEESTASERERTIAQETATFEEHFSALFLGRLNDSQLLDSLEMTPIENQYQQILIAWKNIKKADPRPTPEKYDEFVDVIDQLVALLQVGSEKKLNILRLIQSISLLSLIVVAVIVLLKVNRVIIAPLKQLVNVAGEVGKGNFESKATGMDNNELGVLADSLNKMSSQLALTYRDVEAKVDVKTKELSQRNYALEILYKAAKGLTTFDDKDMNNQIMEELETVLGFGKVSVEINEKKINSLIIESVPLATEVDNLCFDKYLFKLEKQGVIFGDLVWQIPKDKSPQAWQMQILQAMADLIATAIQLEQKKHTEHRLLIVEERAVIARELHDSLAQSLAYLKVQMSLLTRKIDKNLPKEQVDETIDDIKLGLNSAYLHLRELLTTFRLKITDPSIESALQGTVSEFSEKCQHSIKINMNMPENFLSANQEIHILQIIREALSNVYRHAQATKAGVSIMIYNNEVTVEIWDNGIGFTPKGSLQGHFGLSIMEERAKSLNTFLEIKKRKKQGIQGIAEGTVIHLSFER